MRWRFRRYRLAPRFQYSSASRKFGNRSRRAGGGRRRALSVLFCESKIRKSRRKPRNSRDRSNLSVLFCESKIRKYALTADDRVALATFSTLLRVENSEMRRQNGAGERHGLFQYSSASRKFGNASPCICHPGAKQLSVLFCESKIRKLATYADGTFPSLPFQYSSASRKFGNLASHDRCDRRAIGLSVLFCESKIRK